MHRNQVTEVVDEWHLPMAHTLWEHRSRRIVEKGLGVWCVANDIQK